MKRKNYKFLLSISGISGAIVLSGGILASSWYLASNNKIVDYDLKEKEKFLRERTLSLRFTNKYTTNGQGFLLDFATAWIVGKSKTDFSYYLATSMSGFANLIEISNSGIDNENTQYKFINSITDISLIYARDPSIQKNDPLEDLDFEPFKTTDVNIVYTATSYNKYKYWEDNGKIYNYPYSMSDLAILKFDISKASLKFKNFLNYYDKKPTKFAKNTIENNFNNDDYFIGGFPYKGSGVMAGWKFAYSSNRHKKYLVDATLDTKLPPTTGSPTFDKGLNFPKNSNRHFKNISKQVIIENINLFANSFGSIVINQNNEIVGIYSGEYVSKLSESTQILFATFDALITNDYQTINTNITNAIYPKYNLVEQISSVIK